MAPTVDALEGFEHRDGLSSTGAPSGTAIYQTIDNSGQLSYQPGRIQGKCLRVTANGAATRVVQTWPATGDTAGEARIFSGWFRMPSGVPSSDRQTIHICSAADLTAMASFTVRSAANGSTIECQPGSGTRQVGPDVCTNQGWHLLEYRLITSGTTWTIDWAVDGVAYTQATQGSHVATDSTRMTFGTASAHTVTVDWDDCIGSATTGDWASTGIVGPNGNFEIRGHFPNAEGTDVIGSSNAITFTGASTGWDCTNDWASGVADTSTYITYASTTLGDAASNYAELALTNIAGVTEVWGVVGDAAVFAAGTGADSITVRVVDGSNNTLTNIVAGDVSETSLRFLRAFITAPAGGWLAGLDETKIRVGFSGDTNSLPRVSAVCLQAAVLTQHKMLPIAGVG